MGHSRGYRQGTRYLFKRKFRKHGVVKSNVYLRKFELGEFVDVKTNSSIHKGMPHKWYFGRTGKIWNITPKAVGVEFYKKYRGKVFTKRVHIRIEHVHRSKCSQIERPRKVALPRSEPIIVKRDQVRIEELHARPFEYVV